MTNAEVKEILSYMKRNRLYKRVINEIVADSKGYDGKNMQERIQARLDDISHGLSSGIVCSLVYYSQTTKFFNLYRKEIETLWQEFAYSTDKKLTDLKNFDESDPFIRDIDNKNLMAWWSYEEIANELENALYE